jgi:hypothetical protein
LAYIELTRYDRAQVLLRQIQAACGLGDLERAREGFDALARLAPESSEVIAARRMVVEAAAGSRTSD